MTERGAFVELIEPGDVEADFLERAFSPKLARVHRTFYQVAPVAEPCSLVYASSVGNWMNDDPLDGIREDLLTFCSRILERDGIAVFLVYGGNHSEYVLDKSPFLHALLRSANKAGYLVPLFARYRPAAALLVLARSPKDCSPFQAFAPDTLIHDNAIATHGNVRALDYVSGILLSTYFFGKNLSMSVKEFGRSILAVRRFR